MCWKTLREFSYREHGTCETFVNSISKLASAYVTYDFRSKKCTNSIKARIVFCAATNYNFEYNISIFDQQAIDYSNFICALKKYMKKKKKEPSILCSLWFGDHSSSNYGSTLSFIQNHKDLVAYGSVTILRQTMVQHFLL